MNEIDKILKSAEDKGYDKEADKYIENLEDSNKDLEAKIKDLEEKIEKIQNTNTGVATTYKNTHTTTNTNKMLSSIKGRNTTSDHSSGNIGVYSRMIDDFNASTVKELNKFLGTNHPIFNHFNELANKYPNRDFIIASMKEVIDKKVEEIDSDIEQQERNIQLYQECELNMQLYGSNWTERVSDEALKVYNNTNIDKITHQINRLENNKIEVKKWIQLKNNIQVPPIKTQKKIKNNLYYQIIDEFKSLFELCTNVGGITSYRADIELDSFSANSMHAGLSIELQKQLGLCEEPYSHTIYYSNGEGRLVPFELDRRILKYIQENTNFYKVNKSGVAYKSGNIINAEDLFKKVPLYVNKVQYRNTNLIGFNNAFYNITENKIEPLNSKAPILPLKNTKTEIYLNKDIEFNPMQDIFEKCFKKDDAKALLAYLGCCLFDKGYTQRQESLFLMSRGNTGKGLSIDEYLPTPDGWKQMKDIEVGDRLFDESGNICNVTYKSPTHNIDCFKITFDNGFSIVVDKEHRWSVKTRKSGVHTLTTEQMYNHLQENTKIRYEIPLTQPLQLKEQELPIHPYVYGAWLGAGNLEDDIVIIPYKYEQVELEIQKSGYTTYRDYIDKKVEVHGLHSKIQKMGIQSKFIPTQYLRSSYTQRFMLLQGIMDTLGRINMKGACTILSENKQLVEDIRELVFSLGIKANLIQTVEKKFKSSNEPKIFYRFTFITAQPIFKLKQRLERVNDSTRSDKTKRLIRSIERAESIPTQCITVDSPSHLFLATKEFIPTHNTTFLRAICEIFYKWESQLVTKLSDERFGFSMFANNDIIIIDEIQSAKKDFAEVLKNLSTGSNLVVEQKGIDTINIPADSVPRMFLIGNEFPKSLYQASTGEGVFRRILVITPIREIQSLKYTWDDLTTDSCKQWLVQRAIKEYTEQGLHKEAKPITIIPDAEKKARIEKCTYPEEYFLKKHFQVAYLDDNTIDYNEETLYDALYDFIHKCIDKELLESTIPKGDAQLFANTLKKAFNLPPAYHMEHYKENLIFAGIVPKTEEAIDYIQNNQSARYGRLFDG